MCCEVFEEILNLHDSRRLTRDLKMSEVKMCPKCNGEMEVGYLRDAPYWKRGRSIIGLWDGRVFAYKCKNCGYVEFYFEK